MSVEQCIAFSIHRSSLIVYRSLFIVEDGEDGLCKRNLYLRSRIIFIVHRSPSGHPPPLFLKNIFPSTGYRF